jgi:ribose-phosphate pyrophosphokinase
MENNGNGHNICLVQGRSNPRLAASISAYLGTPIFPAKIDTFANGEIHVEFGEESLRNKSIAIIGSTCNMPTTAAHEKMSINDTVMELLIAADAARRCSAARVIAVIPCFPYARKDRQEGKRVPISASLMARLIETAGVDRVITVDLHAGQIQGFFSNRTPLDNLPMEPYFCDIIQRDYPDQEIAIVSPDAGGTKRTQSIVETLGDRAGTAMMDKRRVKKNEVASMTLVGSVKGRLCFILDDMIDTGGTLVKAAEVLMEEGAKDVVALATHPILSGQAVAKINACTYLSRVIVANTLPLSQEALGSSKIQIIDAGPMLGEAIDRIHSGKPMSELYKTVRKAREKT